MPAPVLFAPVGVQTLAHPDGDLASARAAAELGLTYVHSTQGAYKMEDVAAANGDGSRWYQLYWPTDDELAVSFLNRAKAAGYTHLVITLDTTLLGWRPVDLDLGYSPFLENKGIANYTSDPVFRRKHMPVPAEVAPLAAGLAFARVFQNPGLTGPTSRWSARTGTARSCSRGSRARATRGSPSRTGSTASSCRTTADVRSTGRSRRWMRSVRSSRRSTTGCPCSSTPGSARHASRRWRSAPTRCWWAVRTCTASRWTARGARRVMRSLVDEWGRRSGGRTPHPPHAHPFLPDPRALKRRPRDG